MKRTPLLTPALDKPKSLKITYLRGAPARDEGSASDIVVDVIDGDRYFKTRRGWESANFGPLRDFIDDKMLRDARDVATGKFRKHAIKRTCERLLATMRASGATSYHYEAGNLISGWER